MLVHTHELWAGARSFDDYVAEYRAVATSPYRRRFTTLGLYADSTLAASCKHYVRSLRCGDQTFRASGIGAVFTPPALRGQGFATALIGAFLDREREGGGDCAFLFSDIGTAFYERLGFVALPSRTIALRASLLPPQRLPIVSLEPAATLPLRRAFGALERRRPFSLARTALDWEWQRLRAVSAEHADALLTFAVAGPRGPSAYVTGRRVPTADAFVLDELGYASPADAAAIPALLRAAAGDLRTVRGWLPPAPAREALPRGAVRRRSDGIAMLIPLSRPFRAAWKAAESAVMSADADAYWSTDRV